MKKISLTEKEYWALIRHVLEGGEAVRTKQTTKRLRISEFVYYAMLRESRRYEGTSIGDQVERSIQRFLDSPELLSLYMNKMADEVNRGTSAVLISKMFKSEESQASEDKVKFYSERLGIREIRMRGIIVEAYVCFDNE